MKVGSVDCIKRLFPAFLKHCPNWDYQFELRSIKVARGSVDKTQRSLVELQAFHRRWSWDGIFPILAALTLFVRNSCKRLWIKLVAIEIYFSFNYNMVIQKKLYVEMCWGRKKESVHPNKLRSACWWAYWIYLLTSQDGEAWTTLS